MVKHPAHDEYLGSDICDLAVVVRPMPLYRVAVSSEKSGTGSLADKCLQKIAFSLGYLQVEDLMSGAIL